MAYMVCPSSVNNILTPTLSPGFLQQSLLLWQNVDRLPPPGYIPSSATGTSRGKTVTWEPQDVPGLEKRLPPRQPSKFGVLVEVWGRRIHAGAPAQDVPAAVGVEGRQILRGVEHEALAPMDLWREGHDLASNSHVMMDRWMIC